MTPWGDGRFLLCVLFTACCFTMTQANVGLLVDCCLSVRNKTIERYFVADYRQQISGQGCRLSATVLVTRCDVKLCVPADEPWVHDVLEHVERLKRHVKRKNYKGRRCIRGLNKQRAT